ncbi:MAG: hypothetical protein GXO63_01875 [Candidatus Micrarchaeota archaeon]|nr:hypothetical protein [Candidatus Micrarchaeota archaeon]
MNVVSSIYNLGIPELMLWLLTFAVVYGVLSQVNIPKSNSARVIIALVSGFMVLFSAPAELVSVMSQMASSLILVVIGLLVLIIFLEIAGVKFKEPEVITPDGKTIKEGVTANVFEKYSHIFAVIFIIIAFLVFVNAGGLELLGLRSVYIPQNITSWAFLIIVIVAIWFMIKEGNEKKIR